MKGGVSQACDEAGVRAPKLLDIWAPLGAGELGTELGAHGLKMMMSLGPWEWGILAWLISESS